MVGRIAKKMTDLAAQATAAADASQRAAFAAEAGALKRRLSFWGKTVLVLQVIALICMAVGHYV
jgi:hypothetical protein